jgi:AraC family transcriptional regulator
MGIARDGLRGLLHALVESVETGGTGEEVAARVHVSRFHFDRIVGAALEETPGAFCRRLLLERAAHSLAGGASVGEAALEGGYLSPEAFARAFRRAHGVAPSAFAAAASRSGCPRRTASTSTRRGRCSSPAERGATRWT